MIKSTSSTPQEIIAHTDANLRAFAHDAGQRAHDEALQKLGAVMKVQDGLLVIEHRDGSLEVLREMMPGLPVKAGTVLKLRRSKGGSPSR